MTSADYKKHQPTPNLDPKFTPKTDSEVLRGVSRLDSWVYNVPDSNMDGLKVGGGGAADRGLGGGDKSATFRSVTQ